ncbi:hypothetical protein D3C71_1791400 [compost metagenome]
MLDSLDGGIEHRLLAGIELDIELLLDPDNIEAKVSRLGVTGHPYGILAIVGD